MSSEFSLYVQSFSTSFIRVTFTLRLSDLEGSFPPVPSTAFLSLDLESLTYSFTQDSFCILNSTKINAQVSIK